MANLRDGSSGYPTEVDSFVSVIGRPKSGKNELTEDDYNGLANAVVNLQTELGTDPAGSASDVDTRLANVETTHGQVIVAANDSLNKNYADYICDGTADDVQIQAAIDSLNEGESGKIILLAGIYNLAATIDLTKVTSDDVKLKIEGYGAVLNSDADPVIDIKNDLLTHTADSGIEIEGIKIQGEGRSHGEDSNWSGTNDGIKITDTLRTYLKRITIKNCDKAILFDHGTADATYHFCEAFHIEKCYIVACNQGIVFESSVAEIVGYDGFSIRDCTILIGMIQAQGTSTDACIKQSQYCRFSRFEIKNCLLIQYYKRKTLYFDAAIGAGIIDVKGEAAYGDATGAFIYIGTNYEDTVSEHQALIKYALTAGTATEIENPYNKKFHAISHADYYGFALTDKNGLLRNVNGQLNATIIKEAILGAKALYLFNDSSGKVSDYSGNAIHLTNNGATWGTKKGNWGKLDFDGTNDYALSAAGALAMNGDRMIIIALEPDDAYNVSQQIFFRWYYDADNYITLQINGSAIAAEVEKATVYSVASRVYPYAANEPLVLAITIKNNDVKLWINGEVFKTTTNAGTMTSSAGQIYIGSQYAGASLFFDGDIYFCAIYDFVSEDIIKNLSKPLLAIANKTGPSIDVKTINTIAADDTTPDVRYGTIFRTSANTGATVITNFDNGYDGQMIRVIGGSDTNASTMASGTNLKLSGAMTLGNNDSIELIYDQTNSLWIELGRTTWDGI